MGTVPGGAGAGPRGCFPACKLGKSRIKVAWQPSSRLPSPGTAGSRRISQPLSNRGRARGSSLLLGSPRPSPCPQLQGSEAFAALQSVDLGCWGRPRVRSLPRPAPRAAPKAPHVPVLLLDVGILRSRGPGRLVWVCCAERRLPQPRSSCDPVNPVRPDQGWLPVTPCSSSSTARQLGAFLGSPCPHCPRAWHGECS